MSLQIKILSDLLKKNNLTEFYNLAHNYLNKKNKTEDPAILNLLGLYSLKVNKLIDAESFFKTSINKNINYLVLNNLGICLLLQKKNNEAIEVFKNAIKINEKNSEAYIALAKTYNNIGQIKLAIKTLIEFNNKNQVLEAQYLLALLFYRDGEYEKSLDILLIIKDEKITHNIINLIALNYDNLFNYTEAKKYYHKSLQLNPGHFDTLCNLGNLERSLGNIDEAKKIFQKLLSKNRDNFKLNRYYSIAHTYKDQKDSHLQEMLTILKDLESNKNEKLESFSELYFAISKAYEDFKDLKNSCKYILKGNAFKKKFITNDNINFFKKHNLMLKEIFENENDFEQEKLNDDFEHIFIVGMPRSGTTLTEQILSSHSKITSGGELDYLQRIIKKYYPETDNKKFIENVRKNFAKDKFDIRDEYIKKIKNRVSKSSIVVNKLPNNFVFLGFIRYCFPNSKVIHMNRDSKSVCLSIFKNYFPDNLLWYAYNEDDLIAYYNEYKNLISFWKLKLKSYVFELNYDDLVTNPELEIKKVLKYLNLDWEDDIMSFNKQKNKITTVSTTQARKNIYKSSIKGWERYEDYLPELFEKFKFLN
jgi:tetratricopeptide (TPR) repeat protein